MIIFKYNRNIQACIDFANELKSKQISGLSILSTNDLRGTYLMITDTKQRYTNDQAVLKISEFVNSNDNDSVSEPIDVETPSNKIIILWATVRPSQFLSTHSDWMKKAYFKNRIKTRVAVDKKEDAKLLSKFELIITNNTKPGVCFPSYCLSATTEANNDDIIIYASDDFFPPEHWDLFLYEQLKTKDSVLMVNDGLQPYNAGVVTIPIMTFGALKKLNKIIYNPVYDHMHSDVELYNVAFRRGLLHDVRGLNAPIFEHRHYCNNKRAKDVNDTRLENKYEKDNITYNLRKNLSLGELLTVPIDVFEKLNSIEIINVPNPSFSILVCTLPERKHFLDRLMANLTPQLNSDVEVLIESDNGNMKIGKKRNVLLNKSTKDYICFIDDDDLVSDTYVADVLQALESRPDCCSLSGIYTVDGKNPTEFRHSLKYLAWDTITEKGKQVYVRPPNHLNVVKREIALSVLFNDSLSNGEDRDYSDRMRGHLKTESIINNVLYYYLYLNVKKGY